MLIINADDLGGNRASTDNSLLCFKKGRITSASAMVFMVDSERAADLALERGLDTGLHLNFTSVFNGERKSSTMTERQRRIAAFLKINKYCFLFYNPFLKRDFEYVYEAQYEEYVRLYNGQPTHIDGHHHMHLCTNMLVHGLIPYGFKVRRGFTFYPGEKNIFNIYYRSIVNTILKKRHICTDFFFGVPHHKKIVRLKNILELAKSQNVELMVHPERNEELEFLMSDEFFEMISLVQTGNYSML